jgi:glycosyltransferase involved in cell wall biosynthesis
LTAADGSSDRDSAEVAAPMKRVPILYLAPWVDIGGSDKGTIDWFRWLDRDRFAPSLITTQPSPNRRLREVYPFADEVWVLPEHMAGPRFPGFIFDFLHTRDVRLVHIMNSRLAYELMPDLPCLFNPPSVVVQLHVEEPDRSGYVRYVTTRYGNLVDAFSVSSHHLAAALTGYDVPRSKIHVIPTGVDAEDEFNPERARPLDGDREQGAFQILFAGRLTDQKDPMLMVEVVNRLAMGHHQVRVEVVGDGPLEGDVRQRVRELGLERHVRFHPPTTELNRWLAGADMLLMTSKFEGVPYIAYEALAMEVPVVAPALRGNAELMSEGGARLIEPRDNAEAYVRAIAELIKDERLRAELGAAGRARMLESFSLTGMARGHEALYKRLLATRQPRPAVASPSSTSAPSPSADRPFGRPPPLRFTSRPATGRPLVSVITPCYNHGHYLPSMLEGISAQDYPAIEIIIVDDGSDDPETLERLAQLGREDSARVIRQSRAGPSAARNRAICAARGRYILPVDADNVLLPGAVQALVEQLQLAGERVGYIYPTVQYFGNRDYQFRPPAYNLHALLGVNFADTCSLFDREIFDAGLRFAEDIALGHEDWDLALALAAREVIGQPSRDTVMLYRKHGFTRSDLVEYLRLPFSEEIGSRHPELFGGNMGAWGRYDGPALRIKARWNPALAFVITDPVDFDSLSGQSLLRGLANQRCRDFEVIAECSRAPLNDDVLVRRIPPGLAGSRTQRIEEALSISRARYLLVTQSPGPLSGDPTAVERLLRSFLMDHDLRAVVLAELDDHSDRFPWALIDQVQGRVDVHAVLWSRALHEQLRGTMEVTEGGELEALARVISARVDQVQWRHFSASARRRTNGKHRVDGDGNAGRNGLVIERKRPLTVLSASARSEWDARMTVTPAVPAGPARLVPRWGLAPTWMPPETTPMVRLVSANGTYRPAHNGLEPPPGFKVEFQLGAIQSFSPPGTRRLIRRAGRYLTLARGSPREDLDEELGYLEEAPLPLFIGIERALLADGSETLVAATQRDPLRGQAIELTFLGFVEGLPNEPVEHPSYTDTGSRPVLVRWVDTARRRHAYDAVSPSSSVEGRPLLGAELGRLHLEPDSTSIPVWVDADGRISTTRYQFFEPSAAPPRLARYAGAPLAWRDFAPFPVRLRASARRTLECPGLLMARARSALVRGRLKRRALPPPDGEQRLLGYVQSEPGSGLIELFAARHRVLPDQLLTHHALEAYNMGYVDVCSLGYIGAGAPLTGTLGSQEVPVTWAARFGLIARRGLVSP